MEARRCLSGSRCCSLGSLASSRFLPRFGWASVCVADGGDTPPFVSDPSPLALFGAEPPSLSDAVWAALSASGSALRGCGSALGTISKAAGAAAGSSLVSAEATEVGGSMQDASIGRLSPAAAGSPLTSCLASLSSAAAAPAAAAATLLVALTSRSLCSSSSLCCSCSFAYALSHRDLSALKHFAGRSSSTGFGIDFSSHALAGTGPSFAGRFLAAVACTDRECLEQWREPGSASWLHRQFLPSLRLQRTCPPAEPSEEGRSSMEDKRHCRLQRRSLPAATWVGAAE
mmetsp:Transcript_30142/g.85095  ORF Transcript_30142/g.85095 Transcript_30142/m.85095 type:complete len:287 (-) Transcript_30142:258-1118(-)